MPFPADWVAMRTAIRDWVRAEVEALADPIPGARVIWARPNAPAPERPYVEINLVSPPTGDNTRDAERWRPLGTIAIESVVDEVTYSVTIGAELVTYDSGVGATLAQIRDGLKAAAEANATVDAAYTIFVRGDELRLATKDKAEQPEVSSADAKLAVDTIVEIDTTGIRTFTVGVMVYERLPDQGLDGTDRAFMVASGLHDSLVKPLVTEALTVAELALARRGPVEATPQIAGAAWEARAGFDAWFRTTSSAISEVPWIESDPAP